MIFTASSIKLPEALGRNGLEFAEGGDEMARVQKTDKCSNGFDGQVFVQNQVLLGLLNA